MSGSILGEILAHTREELALCKRLGPPSSPPPGNGRVHPVRSLRQALEGGPRPALIAEIKAQSPSAGPLTGSLRPAELARAYAAAGASALSVLTNRRYFGGSLDHLRQARQAVDLPILRKDFIIDPLQVAEARQAGADAVLLIVAALPGAALGELYAAVLEADLEALVEVHTEAEMERAAELAAPLIGINNRDLGTLEVDLETTARLAPLAPPGTTLVSESGIFRHSDAVRLRRAGARAVLVGTALMASLDPAAKARQILFGETQPAPGPRGPSTERPAP